MRYLEFTFKLTPQSSDFEDVLIDLLGEIFPLKTLGKRT